MDCVSTLRASLWRLCHLTRAVIACDSFPSKCITFCRVRLLHWRNVDSLITNYLSTPSQPISVAIRVNCVSLPIVSCVTLPMDCVSTLWESLWRVCHLTRAMQCV
ncbi:hypothetical protein J6590_096746 [Homalodisca vitripennis]|nr:hypothetical protein J6590_096746 [Homalodisca vitripennis]